MLKNFDVCYKIDRKKAFWQLQLNDLVCCRTGTYPTFESACGRKTAI